LDTGTTLTNRAGVWVVRTPKYAAAAQIQTTVVSSPSLWLLLSDGQTQAEAGEELVYTLNYFNNGSGRAYDTEIVATLSPPENIADVTCSVAVPADCQVMGGQVVFDIGTVPGGQGGFGTVNVTVEDPLPAGAESLVAWATISTVTPGDPPANNDAQDVDLIATRPDLEVMASYLYTMPMPGKRVTYTVHYGNQGHIATTGVGITATQPPNTVFQKFASDAGWVSQGDGLYHYEVGDLDYDEGDELLFVVTLTTTHFTPGMSNFDGVFEIHDDGRSGDDADPSSNSFVASMGVPNLLIEDVVADPSIWVSQPGFLTVTVRNVGTGTACGVFPPEQGCSWFSLELFLDPVTPPASYPIEKYGECFYYVAPIHPGLAETVVFSFTLGPWQNLPGFCGVRVLNELWLHTDNWDPNTWPWPAEYGMVPEFNELDNVYGPVTPSQYLYLPVIMRKG
jgi:uncharacterized repeat protein (TIGR01451 family)